MDQLLSILTQYWHLAIVATALAGFSIYFLMQFVVPARSLSKELEAAIASDFATQNWPTLII
jgi:hypothetical protein